MVEYHASKAVGEFKLAAEYISPDMAPTFEDTDCSGTSSVSRTGAVTS